MRDERLVQRWAEWSEQLCSTWAQERGPVVIMQHDASVAHTRRQMTRLAVLSDPASLGGFLFATDFVRGCDIEHAAKIEVLRKLKMQAGLLAEAIQNEVDNERFAEIISAVAGPPRRRGEPAAEDDGQEWIGTFSCNSSAEVWRPGQGHRQYLQGRSPFLDAVVEKVLSVSPRGGRFEVTGDGVFMTRDLRQVA